MNCAVNRPLLVAQLRAGKVLGVVQTLTRQLIRIAEVRQELSLELELEAAKYESGEYSPGYWAQARHRLVTRLNAQADAARNIMAMPELVAELVDDPARIAELSAAWPEIAEEFADLLTH
ncbi:hypothetical protein [Pseudomonas benzopyrenica]|uniref:hypothetical protein n=1 Tax=Pseudomonas benzopyrenica TaxID=2993566 RepID=UPI003F15E65F